MDVQLQFHSSTSTLQVSGCHFGLKPPGWFYPSHHHHLYELLYCLEGEVEQIVGRETVRIAKGEWLLIKSGVKHQMTNASDSHLGFFNVHFDIDDKDIRRLLGTAPYKQFYANDTAGSKLDTYVRELEQLVGYGLLNEKVQDLNGCRFIGLSYGRKLSMQAYTLLVIQEILSIMQIGEETVDSSDNASVFTTDIAHIIEEKLSSSLHEGATVSEIAKQLNMSRSQCSKVFSKIYGLSPRQYMSQLKLNRAKELLVKTHLTIGEIAEELDFHSVNHFSRQFRRWTGMSPNQFRPKYSVNLAKEHVPVVSKEL